MYAIVDIETTGGRPNFDKITEIAIIIHNGETITKRFSTLINPECDIPYYITTITGINNQMVSNAPKFINVASEILELTQNCVFVAHNVSFDYNFIKNGFKNIGHNFNRETLCTVKLSRKAFLGLKSYSLGKLCDSLAIEIKARHRAMGDAEATAIIFDRILKTNPQLFF
ncbi:MAG: 3'-5' exonuclease [Sphingobacteriales bacterium]|nr:MAG: 3'-5' exonuclease [Sphingobacteriales bacterium]